MNIEWDKLGFEFMPTKSNIRFTYADGKWGEARLCNSYEVTMNVAANCLHYGQAIFEGLKAFRGKDGKVRIFRPDENAKRLNSSAKRLCMPEFPVEKFVEAVKTLLNDNIDYIPPYGTGGSIYIRPVMFGTTPQIGVASSKEYELVIMAMPAGPYYKGGFKPVDAMSVTGFDRAAPHGTGTIKCAGNYAASLLPAKIAKENHCPVPLFLDPKTNEFVDEFGTSNFLAITKDGKYVTPASSSILPSITNKSLMQIAEDIGMTVERRPIHISELGEFAEVAACGTAVVITPIGRIFCGDQVFEYSKEVGANLQRLYDTITGIQYGEVEDIHNWTVVL
jgi:branched-chain amino acid aminotransferase